MSPSSCCAADRDCEARPGPGQCCVWVLRKRTLYPFSRTGDLSARPVHLAAPSVRPPASPPWPRGASPGSLGPDGGALSGSPWEEKPAGSSLTTLALQPVAREKAQEKHSQTLNIDLSFSDRARSLLAVSIPWAAGTVQAGASIDDVLPSSLKTAASATRKHRPPN